MAASAVAATEALERVSGPTVFGLVFMAVAASVWLGGLGPALLATAVTAAGMAVVLLEPVGSLSIEQSSAQLRWAVFVIGALVITGLGHVMRSARDRAEASERNLRTVSRASESLEAATEASARLDRLPGALVPELCDGCAVVAAHGPEPSPSPLEVTAPILLTSLSDAQRAAVAVCTGVESPPESAILAPLEARGARIGVLVLAACRGRPALGREELAVATEIARRSALQVDNARLYDAAREMSASLARSEALKTDLLRGASHEFRTPLTAITAAAGALERAEGEEREEMVAIIVEEAERLERLVANLLDLSRLEGGVLEPRIDECSVAELVASARGATARVIPRDALRVDVDPSGPLVRVDPVLCERVVVNLLLNAWQHGAIPIEMTSVVHADVVELVVADSGPGVPPELRDTIFEQFTGSRRAGGLGLGLALSRRLADATGAKLAMIDGGSGAQFSLRLPRAEAPDGGR